MKWRSQDPGSGSVTGSRSAFTLIELLIVIAIIAILAGLVMGIAGQAQGKAARSKALSDMEKIKNALEEFRVNRGNYPVLFPGTNMTATAFDNTRDDLTNATKLIKMTDLKFMDPWGRDYLYEHRFTTPENFRYRIWSYGPNSVDPADDVDLSSGNL